MNIGYSGSFLQEGLVNKGCNLYNLNLHNGESLAESLKSSPISIDLVILELFGGCSNIPDLSQIQQPVAAYCIDTPLNEFWLKAGLRNFDYIFVDQPQSVKSLARCGIESIWLPLPARKALFQPKRSKKRDLVFVGTVNKLRLKRSNLLNLIQSKFKIEIISGLDLLKTQEIFSESKIILNENFFPGLTLRVLQGLSAGTIVFSEQSPYGDDFRLKDNEEIVYYTPENILDRLSELLNNYNLYDHIASQGQDKCNELYLADRVASKLLSKIRLNKKNKISESAQLWNKINSDLLFVQRFGGNIASPLKMLEKICRYSSEKAEDANILIGDIQARFKPDNSALEYYKNAVKINPGSIARLKLALLDIHQGETDAALKHVINYLKYSSASLKQNIFINLPSGSDISSALLLEIADIFFYLGKDWDMGFQKSFKDLVPDTAFDIAYMSWQKSPSPKALEIMLKCLRKYHMQGEMLPYLLDGIRLGFLSDHQLLETARIAFEYYDRDTAATIISALKKIR